MREAGVIIKTPISLGVYHPHKQLKNHQRLNIQTLIMQQTFPRHIAGSQGP